MEKLLTTPNPTPAMTSPTLALIVGYDSSIHLAEIIEESAIAAFREAHNFTEDDRREEVFCSFYRVVDLRSAVAALSDLTSFIEFYSKEARNKVDFRIPRKWIDAGVESLKSLSETCRRNDEETVEV